ncbi:MAG: DUF4180 domain-containing protein [Tissierellia bacterium]|nr:DUF4180 domain-containing protein [Tissierellia bacterium]
MIIEERLKDGVRYNIVVDKQEVIRDESSALDLIGALYYSESKNVIIPTIVIVDEFWDLKNTVAGNAFQKFVQYGIKIAIMGELENAGKSLKAFMIESNKGENLFFVNTEDEAIDKFK